MEEPSQETFEQGCTDAQRDIAAGRPKLLWGACGPWIAFAEKLFRTRFGITVEETDGFVWAGLLAYRRGYNRTVIAHLDATHGSGAYRKAEDEVVQFRRAHYAAVFMKTRRESAALV